MHESARLPFTRVIGRWTGINEIAHRKRAVTERDRKIGILWPELPEAVSRVTGKNEDPKSKMPGLESRLCLFLAVRL